MKTNSGSEERFTLTGTSKIEGKYASYSHALTKRTKRQKGNLRYPTTVDMMNVSQIKGLLAMK